MNVTKIYALNSCDKRTYFCTCNLFVLKFVLVFTAKQEIKKGIGFQLKLMPFGLLESLRGIPFFNRSTIIIFPPYPYIFSERFKKLCDLFFLSKPVRKSGRTASGCTKLKSIFIIALQYTSGKACHH